MLLSLSTFPFNFIFIFLSTLSNTFSVHFLSVYSSISHSTFAFYSPHSLLSHSTFLFVFSTTFSLHFISTFSPVLSPLLTLSLYFLRFSLYYHALLILITSHSTFSLNFLTLLSLSNSTFFVHFPLHSQTIFSSHWNQPNHGMDNHSFPWEFVTKKRIGTQFNPIHGSIPFSISFQLHSMMCSKSPDRSDSISSFLLK